MRGLFPKPLLLLVMLLADGSARSQFRSIRRGACKAGTKTVLDWKKEASSGKSQIKKATDGGGVPLNYHVSHLPGVLAGHVDVIHGTSAGKLGINFGPSTDDYITFYADGADTLSGKIILSGSGPWNVRFMFVQRAHPGDSAHAKDWVSAFVNRKQVGRVAYSSDLHGITEKVAGDYILRHAIVTVFEDTVPFLFVFHGTGVGVTLGSATCNELKFNAHLTSFPIQLGKERKEEERRVRKAHAEYEQEKSDEYARER
jgi:hypothetical protein